MTITWLYLKACGGFYVSIKPWNTLFFVLMFHQYVKSDPCLNVIVTVIHIFHYYLLFRSFNKYSFYSIFFIFFFYIYHFFRPFFSKIINLIVVFDIFTFFSRKPYGVKRLTKGIKKQKIWFSVFVFSSQIRVRTKFQVDRTTGSGLTITNTVYRFFKVFFFNYFKRT